MRKWVLLLMAMVMIASICGCSISKEEKVQSEQLKVVEVIKVEEGQQAVSLDYIGTINAKEMIKYSFKVSGQINKIYVTKGDYVKKGDILAELDTTDLKFQVSAAKATMDAASFNIDKAKDALEYDNTTFNRINALYNSGAASKDQLDQIQMKKDVSESEYSQAKSQYDAAKTDYDYKEDQLKNSCLYAEQDGFVAEKLFNENERVSAYMPIVVVRSGAQIVNVGIPQQELSQISVGAKAIVKVDNEQTQGTITNIAEIPDKTTHTYTAEITVSDKTFRLGSIAKVSIAAGVQKGIWISMAALRSDGDNYVYVIKEGRAFKRVVVIKENSNEKVLVTGLNPGEQLVINGMTNLDDGTKVIIHQ